MRVFSSIADVADHQGRLIGHSEWVTVDQPSVDEFASATGDHQWIHTDPERAAGGPFGGTIAHGFLTLALLPRLWAQVYRIEGVRMGLNYGLNKVRFPAPVPVGSRVRVALAVVSVSDVGASVHHLTLSSVVERQSASRPACVAESVTRLYTGNPDLA